tara:strand:- start:571 stop:708 length:138 start_codon:yes stop_codon:yes gene_type:complete
VEEISTPSHGKDIPPLKEKRMAGAVSAQAEMTLLMTAYRKMSFKS